MRVSAQRAFTVLELLVVIAVIAILMVLVVPAFTNIKTGNDITTAAYTITGVLDQARTYAMSNNTYVWVGIYEEDGSKASVIPAPSPQCTGCAGRLIMSTVASKDGTAIYTSTSTNIDPTRLTQVGKLIKIENVHLPIFADGSGTGSTFDTRPPPDTSFDTACSCYNTRSSRFGDINVPTPNSAPSTNTQYPFQYPVGSPAPTAQYTFNKTLQFNPRGESVINSTYGILRVAEIGLLSTRGNAVPIPTPSAGTYPGNVAAIQMTGLGGNFKIYRR